jgi:hypothetical protein
MYHEGMYPRFYYTHITDRMQLLPQSSMSSLEAMKRARQQHPYRPFEDRLLSFLKHLHDSIPKPDLVQVEEGRINVDGNQFSEEESREIIRRMGL